MTKKAPESPAAEAEEPGEGVPRVKGNCQRLRPPSSRRIALCSRQPQSCRYIVHSGRQNWIFLSAKCYFQASEEVDPSSSFTSLRDPSQPPSSSASTKDEQPTVDEVYAQVKFLRKSVQEVNALLENSIKAGKKAKTNQQQPAAASSSSPQSLVVPKPSSSSRDSTRKTHRSVSHGHLQIQQQQRRPSTTDHPLSSKANASSRPRRSSSSAHFRALVSKFDQNQMESDEKGGTGC